MTLPREWLTRLSTYSLGEGSTKSAKTTIAFRVDLIATLLKLNGGQIFSEKTKGI